MRDIDFYKRGIRQLQQARLRTRNNEYMKDLSNAICYAAEQLRRLRKQAANRIKGI